MDPSNKNIILKIIEYYKENTLLWDRQSKEWHRYNRKVLVLKQLVTQMQLCFQLTFSTKELRQIFCKLRQMYYKVIASADTKSLWCFDDLQFLPAEKEVNKTKKRSAKKCMNELMKVISKILINYPALWDVHNDSFRNRHQKEAVMLELGKQIEVEHTKEELRLAISRLKNFYYNEKSKRMSAEAEQKPFRSSNEEMFTDLKFLEEHVGPYYCTYENCKEGPFKLYDKLKSHLAAHEGRKAFTCKYCDADFSSHGNLEIHIQRRHSNETPYSCPTCSRPFRTMADLRSHSHIHREAKNFVCCLCGKTYHTNAHLNRHYRRHDTDNYQFKCPHCPKKYCEKYRLRDHLNSHMQHREHVCEECGKGFFSQHTLHQHQKLHSDEMNYECNLCGKRFKQVSAMHSHKKYYHNTLSAAELATKTSS